MSAVRAAESSNSVQSVGLPPPIRDLSEAGKMSADEVDLARNFYIDVERSGLMPRLVPDLASPHDVNGVSEEDEQAASLRVRGLFSLLNAIDERLLATVCALILEMKLAGDGHKINVEEVGRRIMGYSLAEANSAAGAALLRAALWIIRFGYENPVVYKTLLAEREELLKVSLQRTVD